jgi:stage V sporulation protein R
VIWQDLEKRNGGASSPSGHAAIYEARESERDVSFLRRFLTRELMEEMHMFEYKRDQQQLVVSRVANEEDWETIKQTLLRNVGMNTVPVIRIVDADFRHNRSLRLQHEHDGRDLETEYLERTMKYLFQLWGRPVLLETRVKNEPVTFSRTENGFERIKQ